MADTVSVVHDGAVAVVTIERPSRLNALDGATLDALGRAMAELQQAPDVRVVILTGSGETAFAAGADIKEMAAWSPGQMQQHARRGQAVCDAIERLGKPVIAAVNGLALGGGCELAAACHLRVAAETASFGQPEVDLGLIPGFGGTQRLTRLVGRAAALDLLLTGRRIAADEARRIGLVHRVVPAPSLMTEARALAASLAAKAPLAVRYVLEAVTGGSGASLEGALVTEAALFGLVAATADSREGMQAFLDKRKPAFKGE